MSECNCKCEVKENGKRITLTPEEVKKFYELKTKEDVGFHAISPEVVNELNLNDEAIKSYIKINSDMLAENLYNSNIFLMGLRKKYDVKDFIIENDVLIER